MTDKSKGLMGSGAVVLMDALGFKGIWKRYKPEVVFEKMRTMELSAMKMEESFLDEMEKMNVPKTLTPVVTYRFLSDTAVIGVQNSREETIPDNLLIYKAAIAASATIATAADPECTLVFRGTIAYGDFAVAGNCIIGPAVDEAATYMNTPDGGFIYYGPSCQKRLPAQPDPGWPWLEWPVPMKGGGDYATRVVTPFMKGFETTQHISIRDAIIGFFDDDSLDVQIKRQNTEAFLDVAIKVAPKL